MKIINTDSRKINPKYKIKTTTDKKIAFPKWYKTKHPYINVHVFS